MAKKLPQDVQRRTERPGNLAPRLSLTRRLLQWGAALSAGIGLSCCFAPLELSFLVWLGLVPVLLLAWRTTRRPFVLGYLFGLGFFTVSCSFLREVFLPAPLGVALVCAGYTGVWLWGTTCLWRNLRRPADRDLEPQTGRDRVPPPRLPVGRQFLLVAGSAALWIALEWIRSWLFSGFPWNQLGVCLWQLPPLLRITRFTGIYGLSFVIVWINLAIATAVNDCLEHRKLPWTKRLPYPLLAGIAMVGGLLLIPAVQLPPRETQVRIAAIQGNIPQIRVFTRNQLETAVDVYVSKTYAAVANEQPELVIWPETAIPKALTVHPDTIGMMHELLVKTRTPMLVGTLDHRPTGDIDAATPPALYALVQRHAAADSERAAAALFEQLITETDKVFDAVSEGKAQDFNSVYFYDPKTGPGEHYDKIQIVPFGEFTPFEDLWPEWMFRLLHMGRSLTPGSEHTIFEFKGLRIGMNICYEDVFPDISRASVMKGANLLLVVTNDAWYGETSGSRQHLSHAVFRAVENQRPLLRNGNNSDSCLILPDGRLEGRLVDPETGNPFYRGYGVYHVPVWDKLPTTVYTRYGDWFAHLLTAVAAACLAWCGYRCIDRKRRLYEKTESVPESSVPVTDADQDASV